MRQRRHSFPCFIRRFSFLFVFPTAGRSIVGGQDKSATPTPPRAIVLGTLHFYFGGASDQSYGQPSVGWTRSLSAYNRAGLLDGCTYRVPVAARQCSDFSSDRWHRDIWSRSRDGPSRHKISHTHTGTDTDVGTQAHRARRTHSAFPRRLRFGNRRRLANTHSERSAPPLNEVGIYPINGEEPDK